MPGFDRLRGKSNRQLPVTTTLQLCLGSPPLQQLELGVVHELIDGLLATCDRHVPIGWWCPMAPGWTPMRHCFHLAIPGIFWRKKNKATFYINTIFCGKKLLSIHRPQPVEMGSPATGEGLALWSSESAHWRLGAPWYLSLLWCNQQVAERFLKYWLLINEYKININPIKNYIQYKQR